MLAAWIAGEIAVLDPPGAPTLTEGVDLGLAGSMTTLGVLLLRTARER